MNYHKRPVMVAMAVAMLCTGLGAYRVGAMAAPGSRRTAALHRLGMGRAPLRSAQLARWQPSLAAALAVTWTQQANIPNPLPPSSSDAVFGTGVTVDKDTLLVGADSYPGTSQLGAAYFYQRQGSTWTLQTMLPDPQATRGDEFGESVVLSGSIAIVGGELLTGAVTYSGAAYVYQNQGGSWVQTQLLAPSDGAAFDGFGGSMARSGNTLAIGASGKYNGIGAVYIYTWTGTAWRFQSEIPSPIHALSTAFGHVVALQGSTLAVGGFGVAFIYGRTGSTWTLQATLTNTSGEPGLIYGESVGVSGSTVAVGACCDNRGVENGLVDIFTRSGSTWSLQTTLRSPQTSLTDIIFGQFLAMQGNTVAVVGVSGMYLFSRTNGVWSVLASFTNGDANVKVVGPFSFSGNTLAATAGAYSPTDSIDIFVRSVAPGLDASDDSLSRHPTRIAARSPVQRCRAA